MNLKSIRKSKGLTQSYIATQLKIGRTTVAMWESGKSMPTADKLPELARILGCTIDDLFGGRKEVSA